MKIFTALAYEGRNLSCKPGKADDNGCAWVFTGRFGGNGTALGNDQGLADGQSQIQFAGIGAARFVSAAETVRTKD